MQPVKTLETKLTHLPVTIANGFSKRTPSLCIFYLYRCIMGQKKEGTFWKKNNKKLQWLNCDWVLFCVPWSQFCFTLHRGNLIILLFLFWHSLEKWNPCLSDKINWLSSTTKQRCAHKLAAQCVNSNLYVLTIIIPVVYSHISQCRCQKKTCWVQQWRRRTLKCHLMKMLKAVLVKPQMQRQGELQI